MLAFERRITEASIHMHITDKMATPQFFETVSEINAAGTTVLLAEQNAYAALKIASRAYVIENGRLTLEGDRDSMLGNEAVRKAYIGA